MADFQSMLARMGMCEDMDRLALQSPSAFQTPSPLVRSTTFQSQSGEGSVAVQQQPEVSKLGREVFDAVAEPGSGASPEDQLAKLREQCVGAMGKVKAEAKSEKEREKRENKEKAEAKLEKERGKIEKAEAKSEKEREKREKKEEAESQKEKEKRRKLDQGITATAVKAKVAKPERQTSSSTVLQLKSENASEGGIMQGQGSEVAKESGPKDSEEQKGTIPKGERLVPKDVKENVEPAPTKEVKRKRRQQSAGAAEGKSERSASRAEKKSKKDPAEDKRAASCKEAAKRKGETKDSKTEEEEEQKEEVERDEATDEFLSGEKRDKDTSKEVKKQPIAKKFVKKPRTQKEENEPESPKGNVVHQEKEPMVSRGLQGGRRIQSGRLLRAS